MSFLRNQHSFTGSGCELTALPERTGSMPTSLTSPRSSSPASRLKTRNCSGGFRYDPIPAPLADYCENTKASHIQAGQGLGRGCPAPGYLDCTPWCVFGTKKESKEYLKEQQGDE